MKNTGKCIKPIIAIVTSLSTLLIVAVSLLVIPELLESRNMTDADILNTRWTVDGYYYTDEERGDSRDLLNSELDAVYRADDGSQKVNYYVFDIKGENLGYIPFTTVAGWKSNREIKEVYRFVDIPNKEKPKYIKKAYRLADETEDMVAAYIWLLTDEDEETLYVLEMLY